MNSAVPDTVECVALTAAALREQAEAIAQVFEDRCAASRVGSFESRVVVAAPRRGLALAASVACLVGAVLVAVFPGWVIARF